jgi:hypothetical protein
MKSILEGGDDEAFVHYEITHHHKEQLAWRDLKYKKREGEK